MRCNFADEVPLTYIGALRGTAIHDARHVDLACDLDRVETQPRPGLAAGPSGGLEILENGFQQIDGDEHVGADLFARDDLAYQQ